MAEDFEFSVAGIDRAALLTQAAQHIVTQQSHLSGAVRNAEPEESRIVSAFAKEEAKLAAHPDVYRITAKDFLAKGKPQPVALEQLTKNFEFLWVRFPVGLVPARGFAFHQVEVRVEFNPNSVPEDRPKAFAILPNREFQTLLKANATLKVSLDESLAFSASAALPDVGVGGGNLKLSAVAKGGAGLVFGPFEYRLKRARIDHTATGLEWVFWRLDGAEFFQEDQPELVVVLQVPKRTKHVVAMAALQASRWVNLVPRPLQMAIENLPDPLRGFFNMGMPLRDERRWEF